MKKKFILSYQGFKICEYNSYDEALDGMTDCQYSDHMNNCDSDCKFDDFCPERETIYSIVEN